MNCNEFHDNLEAYLDDTIGEELRVSFRGHLRSCPSCKERALVVDPTMLFALAENPPTDSSRAEACAAAVTGQIRQERLTRRLHGRRRPWLAAAAAVMIAIGGAAVWQLRPGGGGETPVLSLDAGTGVEQGVAPPTVEVEMPGGDVRVYQFANEDDDTAVYFIVNPALEL